MKNIIKWIATALIATNLLTTQASTYPDRPLKLMVGFPAGQATDTVARLFAEKLTQQIGQSVVVENRPGQGGSVALAQLAKAPADGYTMMITAAAAMVTNPHLYKNVGYDSIKDFVPSAMVVELPLALVAHPSAPFNTVKELIDYAKANPGKLNYASVGNGTMSHLAMERLKKETGTSLVHVPYQGSPRAIADLLAGNVQVSFDTLAVTLPQIEAKKLKPIAVATQRRVPSLPNLPTVIETGVADFTASPWLGFLFPKGTSPEIVNRLHSEIMRAMQDPVLQRSLAGIGAATRTANPQEFSKIIAQDLQLWARIVSDSGARVD